MSYKNYPELEKKRVKLIKELEVRGYEGDRSAKDYQMSEMYPMNYPKIEPDENGLYPEELIELN